MAQVRCLVRIWAALAISCSSAFLNEKISKGTHYSKSKQSNTVHVTFSAFNVHNIQYLSKLQKWNGYSFVIVVICQNCRAAEEGRRRPSRSRTLKLSASIRLYTFPFGSVHKLFPTFLHSNKPVASESDCIY